MEEEKGNHTKGFKRGTDAIGIQGNSMWGTKEIKGKKGRVKGR